MTKRGWRDRDATVEWASGGAWPAADVVQTMFEFIHLHERPASTQRAKVNIAAPPSVRKKAK